jgi:hypothetical protein
LLDVRGRAFILITSILVSSAAIPRSKGQAIRLVIVVKSGYAIRQRFEQGSIAILAISERMSFCPAVLGTNLAAMRQNSARPETPLLNLVCRLGKFAGVCLQMAL